MIREFRPLSSSDQTEVLALVAEIETRQGLSADFYWPQQELQEELWTTEGWGAFLNGQLAGFILYRAQVHIWEVTVVATAPHQRRQRLMEGLFRSVIAAKSHETEIWLEVHIRNLAAQRLYEKLGFRQVGERPQYYRDGASALLYSYDKI